MLLTYLQARRELAREEGQALVEYALIISLIAVLLVGALTFIQGKLDGIFTTIGSSIP